MHRSYIGSLDAVRNQCYQDFYSEDYVHEHICTYTTCGQADDKYDLGWTDIWVNKVLSWGP